MILVYFIGLWHIVFPSLKERLDFAMKEIIYDLLCVGKSHKTFTINPEVCEDIHIMCPPLKMLNIYIFLNGVMDG